MRAHLFKFAKQIKAKINYILDRLVDFSNFSIFWSGYFPSVIQNVIKRVFYFIGNLALFLGDFPRLNAYKIKGTEWTIIFVGGKVGLNEIQDLFFTSRGKSVDNAVHFSYGFGLRVFL